MLSFESIYATTNSHSDNVLLDGVKDGKPEFPAHPGEKPSKVSHKKWTATWRASLTTLGYGAFLRGDVPVEIKKLADRPRLPEPAEVNASIVAKNADIDFLNAQNKIQRDATIIELKNKGEVNAFGY